MSYLVLARKYRPQSFETVVGQKHVTRTLQNAIHSNRVAHALLFCGPRGVGKTSVARILAKAMNCISGPTPTPCNQCVSCKEITAGNAVDVFEIDGASNRGINEIRELRENIKYMPARSHFKIYIIDEVHMLTTEAFNALLKTLEEPPAHVLFILATTEPHKVPVTILSRCQRFDFKRIELDDILKQLQHICTETGIEIDEESLWLVAREAAGSMRDALTLLDQIIAYSDGPITESQVLEILGIVDRGLIFDLSTAILRGDIVQALNIADQVYNQGHDLKQLYSSLLEHFRNLLIIKMGAKAHRLVNVPTHELREMEKEVKRHSLETLNQFFYTLFQEEASIRLSSLPKLAFEMLLIKLTQVRPVYSLESLIQKLDQIQKRLIEPKISEEVRADFKVGNASLNSPVNDRVDEEEKDAKLDTKSVWDRLLCIFHEKYPSIAPALEKSTLRQLDSNNLEIIVKGNSFYANRLRDKKSMAAIEEVCNQFFKRNMNIHINTREAKTAGKDINEETDKENLLRQHALNHPLVTDVLDIFDGKVVEVKIL